MRSNLSPLEIAGSLIAAMTHDLDHPGVNQPFLVATSNHLASLYKVFLILSFDFTKTDSFLVIFLSECFRLGEPSLALSHGLLERKRHDGCAGSLVVFRTARPN